VEVPVGTKDQTVRRRPEPGVVEPEQRGVSAARADPEEVRVDDRARRDAVEVAVGAEREATLRVRAVGAGRRRTEIVELLELTGLADLVDDAVAVWNAAHVRRTVEPTVRSLDETALRLAAVSVRRCGAFVSERVKDRQLSLRRELEDGPVARLDAAETVVSSL